MVVVRATRPPEDSGAALRRGAEILLALGCDEALEGGLGVSRIAELVGREKSQVSRALKALAGTGLVDRDPGTLAYRLGWRLFALAGRAGDARLRQVAPGVLHALVDATGETAHLAVPVDTEVLTVLTETPDASVLAAISVGRRVPAWCTASGRALLFDVEPDEVRTRFAGTDFAPRAPRTPASVDDVVARLAADVARGAALADEELEPGLAAAAAPVRDAEERIVASLNISGPTFRLGQRLPTASDAVRAAAAELSRQLGHQPPLERHAS